VFETRTTHELMQIASAGGGFRMDASARPTHELMQIAGAAKNGGANVIMVGMTTRPTHELMQIASMGRGRVSFEG
jgi:hypothetical protein